MPRSSKKNTAKIENESNATGVRAKPLRTPQSGEDERGPWEVDDEPAGSEAASREAVDQVLCGDEVAAETATPTDPGRDGVDQQGAGDVLGNPSQKRDGTVAQTTGEGQVPRADGEVEPSPTDDDNTGTASKKLDDVIARLQRDYTVLQRALITLEGKEPFEAVNCSAGRGGDRRSEVARRVRDQTDMETVRSYAGYVAERTGLDERTVMRDVQIASGLEPDVIETIFSRRLPMANETTRLLQLSKLGAAQQHRAVRVYANEGKDAFDSVVTGLLTPSTAEPGGEDDGAPRETPPHHDVVGTPPGATSHDDGATPIANEGAQPPSATDDGAADAPPASDGGTPGSSSRATTGAPTTETEHHDRQRPTVASPTAVRDREAIEILRARAEGETRLRSLFPSITEPVFAAALADEYAWVRRRNQAGVRTIAFLRRRTRAHERLHLLEQECATAAAAVPSSQRQAFVEVQRDAAALRARPGEIDSAVIENLRHRVNAARTAVASPVATPLEEAMEDIRDNGRAAE